MARVPRSVSVAAFAFDQFLFIDIFLIYGKLKRGLVSCQVLLEKTNSGLHGAFSLATLVLNVSV